MERPWWAEFLGRLGEVPKGEDEPLVQNSGILSGKNPSEYRRRHVHTPTHRIVSPSSWRTASQKLARSDTEVHGRRIISWDPWLFSQHSWRTTFKRHFGPGWSWP